MKIFVIARGVPSKQEPTWGCFEKDQAEALASLGHNVTILSVDTRFRWYWRRLGITKKIANGIKIYDFFLLPYAFLFFLSHSIKERFFSFLYSIVFQHAIKQEGQPDILYAHYLHYMRYALYLRNTYNIPLVGIEHWSEMGNISISPTILQLARNTYPKLDKLITVSSSLQENILHHINLDKIHVTNNIVGKEFSYRKKTDNNPLTIVSVGGLIYRKGFDILIQALSQIHSMLPTDWKLQIIGEGSLRNALQDIITEKNLEKYVSLLGSKNKNEIATLLQNSDLFVLPSRNETFGVVYIEAMACGLPIIATDCGGPRDIVTEENGLLIPTEDVNALGNAILHMVNNIDKYDRKAIAEDCQARFSPEVIAKQLTQIFEDTIKTTKNKQ